MPKLGQQLPPPPSDIAEMLATVGAPQDSTTPFDPAMESKYTGAAGGMGVRPTTVTHAHTNRIPLYDFLGNDRVCDVEDLLIVTDPDLEKEKRLYVRCPKCERTETRGLHPFAGPNGCPNKPRQKFMTCPICARRGVNKRVYEEAALTANAEAGVEDDEDYIAPRLPDTATREEMLQNRLDLHMTFAHPSESEQLYRIRREPSGDGRTWRIVRG